MPDWTIPAKSFDGVTLPTTPFADGIAVELERVLTEHACQAVATSTGSSVWATFRLEGSLDGANWYLIGSGTAALSSGGTATVLITASGTAALHVRTTGYGDGSSVATTWLTSG